MELLLVIRNAGRQGGDVPVQMAVPLLTTEGVEIGPLNPEHLLDGKGNGPHEKHEPRVVARIQLTDDMLDMGLGRDEDFAGKGGPPVEKGNVLLIFVDDVVRIAGIPGKKGTDETGPVPSALGIGLKIHDAPFGSHTNSLLLTSLRPPPGNTETTCLGLHFETAAATQLGTRYVAPRLRLVLCRKVRVLRGGSDALGDIEMSETVWSHPPGSLELR